MIQLRVVVKLSSRRAFVKRPSARCLRASIIGFLFLTLLFGPARLNQQALSASVRQLYPPFYSEPEIKSGCEPILPEILQPLVDKAAMREGLDPNLLLTVILRESSFQPCAVSPAGAQGLMQLMPETAEELGVRDPFNPQENLDAGARFLAQLLRRYRGNLTLALSAYHVGPGLIDRSKPSLLGPATRRYVSDILRMLASLEPRIRASS